MDSQEAKVNKILEGEAKGFRDMIMRLCEYTEERDLALAALRQCLAYAQQAKKKKTAKVDE